VGQAKRIQIWGRWGGPAKRIDIRGRWGGPAKRIDIRGRWSGDWVAPQTSPALNATCRSLIHPKTGCIQAHHALPDLRNQVRIIHPPPHRTYPSYRVVRTEQDPPGA
jgi:hypothetical protein